MKQIDTSKRRPDWRTVATHERYMDKINNGHLDDGCPLCTDTPLETFTHWKIISNSFPYDRVASKHHMIVPLRHTDGDDLTNEELAELDSLKKAKLNETYNYIMQSLPARMSIPNHIHYHLLVPAQFD